MGIWRNRTANETPIQRMQKDLEATIGALTKEVRAHAVTRSERDDLQRQKDEHQMEKPNGCVPAPRGEEGRNTVCPATGRYDHSEHSVACFGDQ